MSHRDYYKTQAEARGVRGAADVRQSAEEQAYVFRQIVGPWLPAERGARMADLACGHGSFLCWLSRLGYTQTMGVDASPEQVRLAESAGLVVRQQEVGQWLAGEAAGSYRVLFAIDLIEHLTKDEFLDFLRGCNRVVSPGGRLILRYPNGDSPWVGRNLFNDITHVWTYTTNCLATLARLEGFTRCVFVDQGLPAIRDHRWIKVPLGRLATAMLRLCVRAVSREEIRYWSSSIWACLEK